MQRIIVDLPEPEGPQTTTRSPRLTARLTSRSSWNSPYHLCTLASSIIGRSAASGAVASIVIARPPASAAPSLVEIPFDHLAVFRHEEAEGPVDQGHEQI